MKINSLKKLIPGMVFLAAAAACRNGIPETTDHSPTPIRVTRIEVRDMSKPIHTYGRLAAKREMKLSFKIGGLIASIAVDEGQTVAQGEILAQLDPAEISAQVAQARSALDKAQRDQERVENLYRDGAATLEHQQNVQTTKQIAEEQYKAAEFNKKHSEIRAPVRGRILRRLAEEREIIGPGQPVFLFAAADQGWVVRTAVSDRDLVRLKLGDPAQALFDPYPGKQFSAEVSEIVESADSMTGTYEVELKINRNGERFVSGFVAEMDIFPSSLESYFIIPIEALVQAEGSLGSVFTVDQKTGTAIQKTISVSFIFDDSVAVSLGLEGIEFVVTEGAPYLSQGTPVEIQAELKNR